ncbi:unnamed protein product [Larinioides sclopetarius]|uniref:Monocarboxylate transporter n=1 Tax=Larinioides sclopetarius TaxID=280406 RepID=A0AAV1ZYZ1_9ARAC
MGYSEGPDRGHAWVIACAACVITMILSGISKMVGILYVAVIDTYGVSRKEATLPFTFRKSLRCLAGPIVGIVGQRYGIRAVTMAGAFGASLGAFLAFFAPDVTWLTICWGVVHGMGEAFANTLFQVVVNQYFEKYRSTASGIALSGACMGSVMFSFLIEALREAYGLQGTFLVLSAIILHVLPAGILLRSPSWIRNGTPKPNTELTELNKSFKKQPPMYVITNDYVKSNAEKRRSVVSLNPKLLEKNEFMSVNPVKAHSTTNLVESLQKKLEVERGYDNLAFAMEKQNNPEKPPLEKRLSIQNIFATSKESLYEKIPNNSEDSLKKPALTSSEKLAAIKDEKSFATSIKTMLRLYTNPIFLLVCVCMATYVFIFIPIMTSMVDYSRDKGLPETVGKYLIHAMAVGDIIGRLCLGWVTDKEYISIPRYMTLTLLLQGTFILLLPSATNLPSFLSLLAFYSMTAGSMLVRMPVIVLKHVKKEEHSVAMGCYGFASGLVPLGVPSLIGHFRDNFGSYDGMYYLLGTLSIISGVFWVFEPLLVKLKERIEEKRSRKEHEIKV